jgi:hemoglobin-like flavoprotein
MPLNTDVLEKSFNLVEPHANEFAASFYETLFTDCPEAKPLFANTDMEKQQQKLIMSLVYVVTNLRYPQELTKVLREMGEKHATYGAKAEHYPIVGAALLKTLATYLGEDWTPEVKQAWIDAYEEITYSMLEGAKQHEATLVSEESPQQQNEQSIDRESVRFEPKSPGTNWSAVAAIATFAVGLLILGFLLMSWGNTSQNSDNQSLEQTNFLVN